MSPPFHLVRSPDQRHGVQAEKHVLLAGGDCHICSNQALARRTAWRYSDVANLPLLQQQRQKAMDLFRDTTNTCAFGYRVGPSLVCS